LDAFGRKRAAASAAADLDRRAAARAPDEQVGDLRVAAERAARLADRRRQHRKRGVAALAVLVDGVARDIDGARVNRAVRVVAVERPRVAVRVAVEVDAVGAAAYCLPIPQSVTRP
jgi:hypothetical protein